MNAQAGNALNRGPGLVRQNDPIKALTGGKTLGGTYLGYQACHYIPGKQNSTCSGIVRDQIESQKQSKAKKRPSTVAVTVSNDGLNFQFSESAAFYVKVKDIASMSLCPKGKSGKLKIAAVLCRASSKRAGVTPGSGELDMICHVWRPKCTEDLWDFYANFESMLKNRGVNDPYLQQAMTPAIQAGFTKKENRKSVLDHFEKTGIDRLEALMEQLAADPTKSAKPVKTSSSDDPDSDIEIDFSDDESDDDDDISAADSAHIVTLCEGLTVDAEC